jgi:CHAT domain-containing protein
LLRCGLLFSGASNWLRGERLPAAFGDGILSGNDLLSLDLSQYRLLVLSACQTGLGETQSGEGVKGLRRAFELAGVGSMVCTLWNVDDFASALLMKKFYEELLKDPGFSVAAALSKAKAFVRDVNGAQLIEMGWQKHIIKLHTLGYLTKNEENYANYLMTQEKPLGHPKYWAGFIAQGR